MKEPIDDYTHNLNCYLFKDRVTTFDNALLNDKMYKENDYQPLKLIDEKHSSNIIGYINKNKANPPARLTKIRELFIIDDIYNSSNSIIFF